MRSEIIARAPGRVCLFGDHQDYLGLPIIACAIDRYIEIRATPNNANSFNLFKNDLNEKEIIDINDPLENIADEDYLRLVLRVLKRYNCIPNKGYDVEITGTIPISAGLSSSSALTIAWISVLIEAFGIEMEVNPEAVARLAYETEVLEQGSSGGKMDQFTIAMGGKIYLDTKTDQVISLTPPLDNMIIGVSGDPKDTLGMLSTLKSQALDAIAQVKKDVLDFNVDEAIIDSIPGYIDSVTPELQPVFSAAIVNHSLTQQALEVFDNKSLKNNELGELMNRHHEQLKDNLKITTPRIDAMIEAALDAGAYGAKIVGSGGGGCIVAIAPEVRRLNTIAAIKEAGAIDAFSVRESEGAKINSFPS